MKNTEIENKSDFNLLPYNTFRISSVARDVYFPKTKDEFVLLLANLENPLIIGRGSNILLSSYGIYDPVIVTKNLNNIVINPPYIEAEAGFSAAKLSNMALELKLSGFEFLNCIPSTIGGAVCMNAGAHQQCISDYFIEALVYDSTLDKTITLSKEDMNFSYRNSILKNQSRYYLLSSKFKLDETKSYDEIENLMKENVQSRKSQPDLSEPNIGCTFKNPIKDGLTFSAGKLIEDCGMKSHLAGGAIVSHKHANFIVNFNNATSLDYLNLMNQIQDSVYEKFNIYLEPEIIYAGYDKKEAMLWDKIKNKK